jgi:P-type Ca2+ transporter type 2C
MTTVHTDAQTQERLLVFTKGAPDVLLASCSRELVGEQPRPLSDTRRAEILKTNEALAGKALRTLGVAFRSLPATAFEADNVDRRIEQDLVFAGLIGMIDPPRAEAMEAVARAKTAGIRPMMITGDHPVTAAVIAAELGIIEDRRAVTGAEIEKMSDEMLCRTVREVSVYARVNPEHKLRIVKALQREGAIVAMTGDGVNDAPALKPPTSVSPWVLPERTFPKKRPIWCWRMTTSRPSSPRSKKGARFFRISANSCATCFRQTSAKS